MVAKVSTFIHCAGEDAGPVVVADAGRAMRITCASTTSGEQRHQHRGDALARASRAVP